MADVPIRMIPISQLYPHPDNPRMDLGDLTELSESIKARGVMQNLTVIPAHQVEAVWKEILDSAGEQIPDAFVVLIGHRRMAAAKLAGLSEVPCTVSDIESPKDQISIMLVENMQRTDLTPYEQAHSFQMMMDLGGSVEEISRRSGFSVTTVRQRLKMAELDSKTLQEVSDRQVTLSDFDRLAQIQDITARNRVLEEIGTNNFDSAVAKEIRRQKIKANLPAVKKALKQSKLKAIKLNERYSNKYNSIVRVQVESWEDGKTEIPANAEFYYLDVDSREYWGDVTFYKKAERARPEKKPPEQIAKEKRIREAWKSLKEASRLAYQLRHNFIAGLTVTSRNKDQMLEGAVTYILLTSAYHSLDKNAVYGIMNIDPKDYAQHTRKHLLDTYAQNGEIKKDIIPQLIYASFGDSEKPAYANDYLNDYPIHRSEEPSMDALYDWLISLGYKPSDEEQSLRDGTHPAYHMKEQSE